MGKLFNLKEWLTVADAARHLAIAFGEEVTEADVLRLALDKRLRLSVYFVNHTRARCGKVVAWDETEWRLFPNLDELRTGLAKSRERLTAIRDAPKPEEWRPCPRKLQALLDDIPDAEKAEFSPLLSSLNLDGERFLTLSDDLTTLRDVWDLPMIGAEALDVEHKFQNRTDGPAVTLVNIDGAFVEGPDGVMCQLQESYDENEYQAGSLAALEQLKQRIIVEDIKPRQADVLLKRHAEQRKAFLEERKGRPARDNYFPAGGLPKDAVLVVRTESLRDFEAAMDRAPTATDKPLTTKERRTLLTIIAALCDYSAIKHQERGAASQIAKLTEAIGAPVTDDTVRTVLARVSDALEARMK
jgi:hypothetical protein